MPRTRKATESSGHSPVISVTSNVAELDFYAALKRVADGEKVTKLEWNNPNVIVFLSNDKLSIRLAGGNVHTLIVSLADMQGTDWVVV